MSDPIYAIGDIHGQRAWLEELLERVDQDGGPGARLVLLGDLVDRGPDSRGVIDLLLAEAAAGRKLTVLAGNHDVMFRRFLADATVHDANIKSGLPWPHRRLGGLATLQSYGVDVDERRPMEEIHADTLAAVPEAHAAFLAGLPYWLETGDKLFVHAGIVPGVALEDQRIDDLIWIRDAFYEAAQDLPWLVVHGHTALEAPRHFGPRIDLDSGAGYGRMPTAARLEGHAAWVLEAEGPRPLPVEPEETGTADQG